MVELLAATTNRGKLAEIEAVFKGLPIRLIALARLGTWPKVVEDGRTFPENALKKARTLAEFSGRLTLADDSGLEVDALKGGPGILSARYGGENTDDARNNQKLLGALKNLPRERRGAQFVCVLALCDPTSGPMREWVFHGVCRGWIAFEPNGTNGFGYDPLFFYPPLRKTFAELDTETKGLVSHRGRALEKLARSLPSLMHASGKRLSGQPK